MTDVRKEVLDRAENLLADVTDRALPLSFNDIPMSRMVCDDDRVEHYEENLSQMESIMPLSNRRADRVPYIKKLISDQNEINKKLIFVWRRSIELAREREALEKRVERLLIESRRKDK